MLSEQVETGDKGASIDMCEGLLSATLASLVNDVSGSILSKFASHSERRLVVWPVEGKSCDASRMQLRKDDKSICINNRRR